MNEKQRRIVERARDLEKVRIELLARAIEENIADQLPDEWLNLADHPDDEPVRVCLHTVLRAADADTMRTGDMRAFIGWLGEMADEERTRARRH